MAFPLGIEGLYELTQTYEYLGRRCQNKYWYLATEEVVHSASALLTRFAEDVLIYLPDLRHTSIGIDLLSAKNMGNGADFATLATDNGAGTNSGTQQSKFDAWSITLVTGNWLVGKGGKRYAGLTETMLDAGGVASAALEPVLDTLAAVLSNVLTGTGGQYTPVILSPANTRHEGDLIEPIINAIPNYAKSTQNSRK